MSNTIPGLEDLVELRESSYPELGKLWWPRYDQACWSYMHQYRTSPEFFQEVMSHVDSTGVMIQAGGNCGQYVRNFARWFGTVYTFEPDPLNFLCLTLNCGNNVIKTQACIGNDKKFVNLNVKNDAGAIHVEGQGNVPTVIIDELDLPGCGLIQLDVEGYEYFALLGARRTIEKYHPVIMVEWCEPWAARYSVTTEMLDEFFTEMKYSRILDNATDIVYKYTP